MSMSVSMKFAATSIGGRPPESSTTPLSVQIHNSVRDRDYEAVQELIANSHPRLLWEANTIGWTALHFAASHGTPNVEWWRWILGRALEPEARSSMSSSSGGSSPNGNPFLTSRTSVGHSCVDMFFQQFLHPLPWQRARVDACAASTRFAIREVLQSLPMLQQLRDQILRLQQGERARQKRVGVHDANAWLVLAEGPHHHHHHHNQSTSTQYHYQPPQFLSPTHAGYAHFAVAAALSFWQHMELLLMATYLNTLDMTQVSLSGESYPRGYNSSSNCQGTKKKWRVLHALAYTGSCPLEVAKLAIALYPDQIRERDEAGNLPLHIAAASPSGHLESDKDVCPPMIQVLLEAYPQAAQCANSVGRLPLNVALASGKTWGTAHALWKACPKVLYGTRDVPSGMASFALAAMSPCHTLEKATKTTEQRASRTVGGMWRYLPASARQHAMQMAEEQEELLHLNTVYELLRVMPDAVQYGIPQLKRTSTTQPSRSV